MFWFKNAASVKREHPIIAIQWDKLMLFPPPNWNATQHIFTAIGRTGRRTMRVASSVGGKFIKIIFLIGNG